MANSDELPGFRDKRKTLFGEKTGEEEMRETGRQFMEAGQFYDALEFFARCEAPDQVKEIARRAKESGNTPLFLRARVVQGEQPGEEELLELARSAREGDRLSMAVVALQKAGHEEEAQELRRELLGGEEPGVEPGAEEAEPTEVPPEEDGPAG
jgi:hypothetical protein